MESMRTSLVGYKMEYTETNCRDAMLAVFTGGPADGHNRIVQEREGTLLTED